MFNRKTGIYARHRYDPTYLGIPSYVRTNETAMVSGVLILLTHTHTHIYPLAIIAIKLGVDRFV